jgi:hypothetical protein
MATIRIRRNSATHTVTFDVLLRSVMSVEVTKIPDVFNHLALSKNVVVASFSLVAFTDYAKNSK